MDDYVRLHCAVCDAYTAYVLPFGEPELKALCAECLKNHFLTVEPIDPGPADEKED